MNEDKKSTTDSAIALKYDGENAPLVIAKGEEEIAQQIVNIAKDHGIMIHQDAVLTMVLSRLEIGDEIPENLYIAIARIIAFAYYLNDKNA